MSSPVHVRTQLVSFLFMDLVAFSKESTTAQHQIKAVLIERLNTALAPIPAVEYLLRDTGDGCYVAFWGTPELALYTALALWQSCGQGNEVDALPRLRLRVGLHIGTVKEVPDVEGRTNYVGDGINAAKRIQDLAAPGQILASRSFFDAFDHLDTDYARLFSVSGSGDDKHGRSYELFALNFIQVPFEKLALEVLHMFGKKPAVTELPTPKPSGFSQTNDFIRQWFIPVNALLFSITFYISNIGKIADPTRALEYTGVGLLMLSLLMGLAAWWFSRPPGRLFSRRHVRLANLLQHKPVTWLSFVVGLVMLGGAWLDVGTLERTRSQDTVATPRAPVVAQPEPSAMPATSVNIPSTPASATAALPPASPKVAPGAETFPMQIKKSPPARTEKTGKPHTDTAVSNPRCTSLLQRAGSGEPLTPQEQHEMVTSCQ